MLEQFPVGDTIALEKILSDPTERALSAMARISGDLLVLGAGGKMGPTLARMARCCFDAVGSSQRVIAVSRFRDSSIRESLQASGVETLSGDLFDPDFVESLPRCENVVFMVGMKFGTTGAEPTTWATNTYLPGVICRRFSGSRIVCLSTGNVYGLVPVQGSPGSVESDTPNPVGEYAMSSLGRERIFEYFSRELSTPVAILRVNYATELRYGVLVDLALQIFREEPISLVMSYFNVIWQPDACAMILGSLAHAQSPSLYLNITGPERACCREICEQFGRLMHRRVRFCDTESNMALLSDSRRAIELLGPPKVTLDEMVRHTAGWIDRGGATWGKPTHFQVSDGRF